MPKKLILCADGTWNNEDGAGGQTNVARLHRVLQNRDWCNLRFGGTPRAYTDDPACCEAISNIAHDRFRLKSDDPWPPTFLPALKRPDTEEAVVGREIQPCSRLRLAVGAGASCRARDVGCGSVSASPERQRRGFIKA